MESIILAIAKKDGVSSVESIIKKSGFGKKDVIKALYSLARKGKLNFISNLMSYASQCSVCAFNKFCKREGNSLWN